jgi:uncharacterized protein
LSTWPTGEIMTSRVEAVDGLRAFALFGIAVVNMPFLAAPFGALPNHGLADTVAAFLIGLLFQGKFFLIFAFLFGWGMGVQQASAQRRGSAFAGPFFARQFGLLAIGIAHATLVFAGDILVTYALVGALVWPMRQWPARALMRAASSGLMIASLVLGLLGVLIANTPPPPLVEPGYLGTWANTLRTRLAELPSTFVFILMFNGPMVFAAFCAGLAAQRSGFLATGNALFLRLHRHRWAWLIGGIALNLPFALLGIVGANANALVALIALASLAFAAPVLSLGYLLFVAGWVAKRAAPSVTAAGRMSLTAYVLEGIFAGLVFNGYGLGLYGQLGSAAVLGVAVAVYLGTEIICAGWTRWRGQGPLERLLRKVVSTLSP